MRPAPRPAILATLVYFLIVLPLGLIEGWYGRVDYSGDAIPYLDMANALHNGAWKLAFNPLWGFGYAALIAFVKIFFPDTPSGEWHAVHLLNIIIYTACYFSFLYLLRNIAATFKTQALANQPDKAILVAGTALFLSAELCLDTVSRVGPDTLVTTLILLALALVLRLREHPSVAIAMALGATLGCGYVVKTIFLPLSLVIVLVAAATLYRRRIAVLVWTLALAALFAIPYAAGLSWSFGRLTLGESGSINYAWHVNRLDLMHWQGGPSQFGKPVHPTTLLLNNPPIYGFAQPFNVSYPPFFNPPYYYEGYRHFFSPGLQAHAIAANLLHLYQALRPLPITYAVILCLLLIYFAGPAPERRTWLRSLMHLWPILIPALAGIALYVQVHLEGRYLPSFLLVLAAAPITLFLARRDSWPDFAVPIVVAILAAGSLGTLLAVDRPTIQAARHNTRYSNASQWIVARYLLQHGLHAGDDVAVIAGPSNHCTWAHVDHLRIVAELEADIYAPADAGANMYWDASPQQQTQIIDTFAKTTAKVILARTTAPKDYAMPDWSAIAGTDIMVHQLHP